MAELHSVQTVLELACAAQRTNNGYFKEAEYVHDDEGKFRYVKHDNKTLIRHALGVDKFANTEPEFRPVLLTVEQQDIDLADTIRSYFKRLMFSAVKGDNEFQTEVFSLLMTADMPANKIGWIASLPSVYKRDLEKNTINKELKLANDSYLAEVGEVLFDRDCKVLQVRRSQSFNAWNVLAVIDNNIASWMSSKEVSVGDAVVIKCKVKQHGQNWLTGKKETRLNYVKIAQ